jgi:hypothetical protein
MCCRAELAHAVPVPARLKGMAAPPFGRRISIWPTMLSAYARSRNNPGAAAERRDVSQPRVAEQCLRGTGRHPGRLEPTTEAAAPVVNGGVRRPTRLRASSQPSTMALRHQCSFMPLGPRAPDAVKGTRGDNPAVAA